MQSAPVRFSAFEGGAVCGIRRPGFGLLYGNSGAWINMREVLLCREWLVRGNNKNDELVKEIISFGRGVPI